MALYVLNISYNCFYLLHAIYVYMLGIIFNLAFPSTHEYHQSVKQFGVRSGLSGSKLFAKAKIKIQLS